MEGAVANLYVALCFILATSSPTMHAFPITPYYQTAFFQQSSAINAITGAITVSCIDNINRVYNLLICEFSNRMQL